MNSTPSYAFRRKSEGFESNLENLIEKIEDLMKTDLLESQRANAHAISDLEARVSHLESQLNQIIRELSKRSM